MKPILAIYPNPKRDPRLFYTKTVAQLLLAQGAQVILPSFCQEAAASLSPRVSCVGEEEFFSLPHFLITLGGDGTILSVATQAAKAQLPIFGINLGTVGFMTSLEEKELDQVGGLLTEPLFYSQRMMLSCQINENEELLALNEFILAPDRGFHMVEMDLAADGKKLCRFRADGVILHTPTGSTGYAFSAGGAAVDTRLDCIGVQPVSSYMRHHEQHMLFSPETCFTVSDFSCSEGIVTLCADGKEQRSLSREDRLFLSRAKETVNLVSLRENNNFDVFFRKF